MVCVQRRSQDFQVGELWGARGDFRGGHTVQQCYSRGGQPQKRGARAPPAPPWLRHCLCSQCTADNCLDRKAFAIAMEESCLPVSDPIPYTSSFLYTFSNNIVCLVHDNSLHVYKSTENKWFCTSCSGVCPERKVVIEYQETLDTHLQNHEYHPIEFRTVTTESIPHTLSEEMRATYRTQISQEF